MNYTVGKYPSFVISGYFDNDVELDLVAVNRGDNSLSVLLGNGNGTFLTQKKYSTGSYPSYVIAGDLNNDKKLDLVVTNEHSGDVSVFLNICT
jgi:hypothetical protein